ncbi:adenylate kinase-domain-containing protein [Mucor mucedo]|uniref:adenylate kinase-domain-containing protein n=1 Tax=Mucor mucedo TaxID=29922 RepID=UPI0022204D6E|nr:adenylate kinase-domain-containing protein [Mucor mucedo]KAI7891228.1 adenylate kinase-domain-containing protein [Mucor mucedo]
MFRNLLRSGNRLAVARQQRLYSTVPPPKQSSGPTFPAMLAVASMGFAAYYTIVKSREGNTMPRRKETTTYAEEEALKQKRIAERKAKKEQELKPIPAFSPEEVTVVFVLGGPGAGKGTQCENLTKDYGFVHLSAGDLLRAEQKREGSKYGELINHYIREGLIVPMEVTIALLEQAMKEAMAEGKAKRFLIDGFPRKMDQAVKFEEVVVPSKLVLFFECPEEVMLKRLLKRGESSGRVDDNIESIRKRFNVFTETSMPVIDAFEKQNKVKKISCDQPIEEVYQSVKTIFDDMFAEKQ